MHITNAGLIRTTLPALAVALAFAPAALADPGGQPNVRAKFFTAQEQQQARETPPGLVAREATPLPSPQRGRDDRPEPQGQPFEVPGEAGSAANTVAGSTTDSFTSSSGVAQDGPWSGAFGSNPNRQIGKLYFDNLPGSGTDYRTCSGTVVTSENRSLVVTAGHCVYTPDNKSNSGWHENYIFCPGYESGCQLGVWAGRGAVTTPAWASSGSTRDDIGVVLLQRSGTLGNIADAVGAQGIAFNQSTGRTRNAFGYPRSDSRWPDYTYSGEDLIYSKSTDIYGSGEMRINSTMTGGSSGGPWLISPSTAWHGYVNSVNSWKPDDGRYMYGPYFGSAELDVYQYSSTI